MKVLLEYLKKTSGLYAVGTFAMLMGVILDMFNPRQVQRVIDEVIIGGRTDLFGGIAIIMVSITVGRAIFGYFKEYMFDMASSKVTARLRIRLFDHIQRQSFAFFDRINTGELMSRMKEDTESIMNVICFGMMLFVEQSLYFVIAAVLLFRLDWRLALVSLSLMPVIAFVALRLEKKIGFTFEKISDQRAALNTTAQENLAGVRLVKAFGREKHEIGKFLKQNEENAKLNVEQAMVVAKHQPVMDFFTKVTAVLVISVGGVLVIRGEMTIGTLVAFNSYVFMLIWPMQMLGWLVNMLAQCRASLKKIDLIFQQEPEIQSPAEKAGAKSSSRALAPDHLRGHIEFRNVSLEMNGMKILQNISFEVRPGSTVAIMGETGSGKSSLIHLIGRYYDCTGGSVMVDGVDVREYDLQALRRGISVVMQDVFLFSDTIKRNILFGYDLDSEEKMTTASQDAHIHSFVSGMREGYETTIGERGIGLSGGQKQRISIARAIARDCGVLILDDSTSALDLDTEHRVWGSIGKRRGMTKLMIAHRVSAVRDADEILYLSEGQIVERGTHKELLALKGRYYETWAIQQKGQEICL
ncbi:MAG: ABC transporter ATP-binding protein [Saccharofermentanales bacterium]